MFAYGPRFPLKGLALVAIGFLLANAISGGGSGAFLAGLLFVPLLILKMMFIIFLVSTVFRFAAGGHHHRDHYHRYQGRGRHGRRSHRGPWADHHQRTGSDDGAQWWYKGRSMQPSSEPVDPERLEWEEHLREARREVDDLDGPYVNEPPA